MNVGYFTTGLMIGVSTFGIVIRHGDSHGGGWAVLLIVALFALCILIITDLSKDGR